jgi:hypothetical protein
VLKVGSKVGWRANHQIACGAMDVALRLVGWLGWLVLAVCIPVYEKTGGEGREERKRTKQPTFNSFSFYSLAGQRI